MALPDYLAISSGTGIILADTTDHGPAPANNLGTRTDQIDLTSLPAGGARQSDKIDFGQAGSTWDEVWAVMAVIEWATAPAAGEIVSFYNAPSISVTPGTANPGGVGGADLAYSGYALGSLANSLKHLQLIGVMSATVDATTDVQVGYIGAFRPRLRYGTIVVYNESAGDAFVGDAVEMSILLQPIRSSVVDT